MRYIPVLSFVCAGIIIMFSFSFVTRPPGSDAFTSAKTALLGSKTPSKTSTNVRRVCAGVHQVLTSAVAGLFFFPRLACLGLQMQDCPEEPTHGYDGEAATFCQAHMAVGMKVSFAHIRVDQRGPYKSGLMCARVSLCIVCLT